MDVKVDIEDELDGCEDDGDQEVIDGQISGQNAPIFPDIRPMSPKKIKLSVSGIYVHHGSYYLRQRPNGRRVMKSLGRLDKITMKDAEAIDLEFLNGQTIVRMLEDNSENITFLGIFQDLCDTSGKARWKPSIIAQHSSLVHGVLEEFHDKPIADAG